MTADLERIAREAGFGVALQMMRDGPVFLFEGYDCTDEFKTLAALIAADCANLCSHMPSTASTPYDCADAIRERYGIAESA